MRLVMLIVVLAAASVAEASAPNCGRDPFVMMQDMVGEAPPRPEPPPWVKPAEGVRIERLAVHLDCADGRWPHCGFDAELVMTNDSRAEIATPIELANAWTLSIDRQQVAPLPAAGRATVRVHGRLDVSIEDIHRSPIPSGCSGSKDEPPVYDRHLLSASRGATASVELLLPATGALVVTFDRPSGWQLGVGYPTTTNGAVPAGVLGMGGGRTPSPLRVGGPFLGAGGGGASGDMQFRMRAGYEVARPGWLLYAIAAETDFDEVTIAPTVEVALSTLWMQVHAIGVGVPVRLGPDPAIGIRGQVTLGVLPAISAVMTIDRIGGATQLGVYGQLSL